MMEKIFLHADLDAFFASVEQLDHPEYRGKPVIVSGLPGDRRCVVSTASYEARKFGVHSAMPAKTAFQLCPNGIFVRPDMKRYHEKSHEVMSIFRQYSPDVIQMSVDEAFIDLTGTERLLGPAEQTARRIKQQVLKETGLTISIGMASTMYLAKIASGYRKPDGLTIIAPGDEEKFMLSLPLNKLWGAGEKTLERLNKAGFRTTLQIYNKTEGLLQSIFGENTGSFLYNSVRGNRNLIFGNKAENHSISSEKTFEYDLTDRDAIETALLQLAHTVMFRLHRENVHSRTLALKIRYDDFTTVSIQQTCGRNFSSVDDLFERSLILFNRKYNKESGIRLLGLAADKVEDNSIPSQKELFDFGEEKKSKIEKAIMNLEDKLPGVKIQKARTLHKALLFFAAAILLSNTTRLYAQNSALQTDTATETNEVTEATETTGQSEETVTSDTFSINLSGFWEAGITTGFNSTFGFGKSFSSSFVTPVFTQNADLSLTAQINKNLFFEGKFADTFEKNTIAAVYKTDGLLKELRIANRGISFPKGYSVSKTGYSIGGGQNLAPGISIHLQNEKLIADAVLRYDMLSQKSKTFYGKNSVTSVKLNPGDYIRGREFVLPDSTMVSDIDSIYVENINGIYSDSQGRKYKKLSSSEYLLNAVSKTIVFSNEALTSGKNTALPEILLTYKTLTKAQLVSKTGSYEDGNTFLGKIQSYFDNGNSSENQNLSKKTENLSKFFNFLSKFSQNLSKFSFELFTELQGQTALVIQKGSYFSPFAVCCRYDAGYTSSTDAFVINSHSGTKVSDFTVTSSAVDETHLWLTVKNCDTEDFTLPEYRYPFALYDSGCYLNNESTEDFTVEARTYSPVNDYYIGTNAAEGTVFVYINDILDDNAQYSFETGIVKPSVSVNSQDKVFITWSEDNVSFSYGSPAFGAAFKYLFTNHFSSDISVTGRWSLPSQESFAASSNSFPGFCAFTAGLKYENNIISIQNAYTVSVENENTSGKYRILSMDDCSEKQNYLSEDSAVNIPSDTGLSLNINSRTSLEQDIQLKKETNCTVTTAAVITDSEIEGYAVPLEWNFTPLKNSSSEEYVWAARTIDLGSSSAELSTAEEFSIALYSPAVLENIDLYMQLGVTSSQSSFIEEIHNVPTWKISRTAEQQNSTDVIYGFVKDRTTFSKENIASAKHLSDKWQQVTVKLTGSDRAQIADRHAVRIIAVTKASLLNGSTSRSDLQSALFAGPWSFSGNSFSTNYDSSYLQLRVFQFDRTADEGSLPQDDVIKAFNRHSENYAQNISWNTKSIKEDFSDKSNLITLRKYFEPVSLSSYKNLNFYFKYNPQISTSYEPSASTENYAFTIDFESNETDNIKTQSVHLEINSEQAAILKGTDWHTARIDLENGTLFIDSKQFPQDSYIISINRNTSVSSAKIILNIISKAENCIYNSGSFAIDEIYLSETETNLVNKDKFQFAYKNTDNPLMLKDKMLLGNIDFSLDASGTSSKQLSSSEKNTLSANANAKLNFDSINLSYGMNTGINYSSDKTKNATVSQNAQNITGLSLFNYSVKTKNPFLNIFSFSTDFTSNIISATDSSSTSAGISLSKFNIPLELNFKTQSLSTLLSSTQQVNATAAVNTKYYSFNAQADFNQKTPSEYKKQSLQDSFISTQKNSFSTGSHNAQSRQETLLVKNSFNLAEGKIKPSLTLKGTGNQEERFKDSVSLILELPVQINTQTFLFGWNKQSSSENNSIIKEKNPSAYAQDISFIFSNIQNRPWIWKSYPFADLFTKNITASSNDFTEKSSTDYYITWSKPLTYTAKDLFIPSGATVSFTRQTETSTTVSDYYLLKLQTLFSALNVFGKAGSSPVFKWYEQDYFSTYIILNFKIPKQDSSFLTTELNINIDNSYYLENDGLLQITADSYIKDKNNLSIISYLTFKRKAESSPIVSLISLFSDKIKPNSIKLNRINILSYQFAKTQSSFTTDSEISKQHKASFSHSLEASVTNNLTVNTGITGTYSVTQNDYMFCGISISLGAKLLF